MNAVLLCISIASLLTSFVALYLTRAALLQAKQVADRDLADLRQTKWFDLYFEANAAYDDLEEFQSTYSETTSYEHLVSTPGFVSDWNHLISTIRRVHSRAAVFPLNSALNILFENTALLTNPEESYLKANSQGYKEQFFDAVENLRQMSAVSSNILVLTNSS